MIYGIIGTGAIGGYYGGKLAHAGKDVHFLLHKDYQHVVDNGLQINSCNGSFHLDHPFVYNDSRKMPKCDIVFVCLKSVNNNLLKELITPIINNNTLVVLIQNGIGLESDVQQIFPGLSLAAGQAFICCAKTEPGIVNHQCYGSINIGNYSCPDESLVRSLTEDFKDAGIEACNMEYNEARWKKAVWNMPFNGLTVALNTQTDLLLKNPATMQLVRDLMMETIEGAKACGVQNIDASFADKMIDNTIHMTPYSPSMKLDYDFHRPMEIHYLYTRPIEEAAKAGYQMKKLKMLEAELIYLNQNNR